MNSLLLGVALATSPSAAGLPPGYPPPYPPGHGPHAGYPQRPPFQLSVQLARYQQPPVAPDYPPPAPPVPYYPPPQYVPPPPVPAFALPPDPGHHGPMTLEQFEHGFKPTCGTHHLCFIHPVTCRPVHVCLTLPHGCPKVCVHRRSIELDYGRQEIEIEFNRNGTVSVDHDD